MRISGLPSLPQGTGHLLEQLFSSRAAKGSRWRGGFLRSIFKLVEMFSVNTDSKNKGTVRSVLVSLFFSIKGNNLSHH